MTLQFKLHIQAGVFLGAVTSTGLSQHLLSKGRQSKDSSHLVDVLLHLVTGSVIVITLVMLLLRLRKFTVSCCLPLCPNLLPPALTNTSTPASLLNECNGKRNRNPSGVCFPAPSIKNWTRFAMGLQTVVRASQKIGCVSHRKGRGTGGCCSARLASWSREGSHRDARGRTQLGIRKYNNSSCNMI